MVPLCSWTMLVIIAVTIVICLIFYSLLEVKLITFFRYFIYVGVPTELYVFKFLPYRISSALSFHMRKKSCHELKTKNFVQDRLSAHDLGIAPV